MKLYSCESCNNKFDYIYSFCPYCGAKVNKESRRPKLKQFEVLSKENTEKLRGYASEFVEDMCKDEETDEDMYHYLMEEVVKMFYGEDAFEIIYRRNR